MNTAVGTRCFRCDAPGDGIAPHKCAHRRSCYPFDNQNHCPECKRFKERQVPMFSDDSERSLVASQLAPFIKFAGSKRRVAAKIIDLMPRRFDRYYEPFVGGGAVFFALMAQRYQQIGPTWTGIAYLNDLNRRLVRTYRAIRSDVDEVIDLLGTYPISKDFFLELRSKAPDDHDSDVLMACWFLYLNRTAFNGLYRVNRSGQYNVPWGKYKNPVVCKPELLRACSLALQSSPIRYVDFADAVSTAIEGDVVYMDPPYSPVSATSNFTSYTAEKFDLMEQTRLRDTALKLKERGAYVMISNSDTEPILELYGRSEFTIHRLTDRGSVAASKSGRGDRTDLLIM